MWSPWSHVATIVPGERVIDARWLHGVCERPLAEVIAHASKHAEREWFVPDAPAGYAWLREQVGRPYDTAGVIGLGLRREWQDEEAWFCSELHEQFLEHCGLTRFVNSPRRVTPQHSWMVA
jgi:hypothetical protein